LGLVVSSKELFSTPQVNSRSAEPCCDKNTISCYDVEVDTGSLHTENGISINGMALEFSNRVPPHGYVYKTVLGNEAVISFNEETGNVFGTLKTHDGRSFALEKCGNNYIFEEFDLHTFAANDLPKEAEQFPPADLKLMTYNTSVGTYNSSIGTYNSSLGTNNSSMGTHNFSFRTFNSSFGTYNSSFGTYNSSFGTYNSSIGTYNTSTGPYYISDETYNSSMGTYNSSMGTYNSSFGTYNSSFGTYNSSFGTYYISDGTYNSSIGTYNSSMGTYNSSFGTYNSSMGTYNSSFGHYNSSIGMNRNEIVTYSVMIYYTAEFAATTPNIRDFVDQVIAETNQGYINSQIPVRAKLHCTEQATIPEIKFGFDMFQNFITMKKDSYDKTRFKNHYDALRNTADAAALLVNEFQYCGIGRIGAYANGHTFSVTEKSCALGYYTFGHELGHNFGCAHDKGTHINPDFSYGHGHLIQPTGPSKYSGYRTNMAYFSSGHYVKVNYYSNPDVIFPDTGTPTGVAGLSNNAKVITDNRYTFAALGDESGVCEGPQSTTSTTTATTTSIPSFEGCNENQEPTLLTIARKKKVATWSECRDFCNKNSECEYFQWKNNSSEKKRYCLLKKVGFKNKKGFVSGERFCGTSM